jgi:diadenylate cyclase
MELFKLGFITIRLVDIIDISVVTLLFYKLYDLLRGSLAIRILFALLTVFLFWKLVDLLEMVLLKSILDEFLGVGAIALIVIFSTEIRRFLVILGRNTLLSRAWVQVFAGQSSNFAYHELVRGVEDMAKSGLGALIVVAGEENLERIKETGDPIGAALAGRMLLSIFLKDSPLHDGAVLIEKNAIAAARCVLPLSIKPDLPPELGLRHRSALGMSETSDALIIIVSEERQEISLAKEGVLRRNIDPITLEAALRHHLDPSFAN